MEEKEFNLVDQPWICVMDLNGDEKTVSLKDALLHAHEFSGLNGELPTQDIAVLRLLLAHISTIFRRVDMEGDLAPFESTDDAFERWQDLWENGSFPQKPIEDYLNKWSDRYWLFDPERPFMQARSAAKGTHCSAAKLIGEVSESASKPRLFKSRAGDGLTKVPYDEAARWLIYLNGFDDAALKPHIPRDQRESTISVAWLGRLGLVYAQGKSLFETLMLNLTLLKDGKELWPEPHPDWELDEPREMELRKIAQPDEPAALFTTRSRLILLEREDGNVVGYNILCGDSFDSSNSFVEQMTRWRYQPAKKDQAAYFFPMVHAADRQMWRDIGVFCDEGPNAKRPGVVDWICELQNKKILDSHSYIQFARVGNRYDSSQRSTVTDIIDSQLIFHATLLEQMGSAWRTRLVEECQKIEDTAYAYSNMSANIFIAGGGDSEKKDVPAAWAKEQCFTYLDEPFCKWLYSIDPEKDNIDDKIDEWHNQIRNILYPRCKKMVADARPQALFGHTIKVRIGSKEKQQRYSAPEAYIWFKIALAKIYPVQKKEEDEN